MRFCIAAAVIVSLLATDRPASAEEKGGSTPSIFISCAKECFDDYLRQALSYFNFARDPYLADFTVVIVRQRAGNGGERFTVRLARRSGKGERALQEPGSFTVPASVTNHAARQQLLQVILRALQAELWGTPHAAAFELALPTRDGGSLSTLIDPWNYWVVAPELGLEGEGGSGYLVMEASGAFSIRRITEGANVRLRGCYIRRLSSYLLEDGSRIHGDVYNWEGRALYAHSMGEHWALGGVGTLAGTEFENLKTHSHGGGLAEYNIFPYTENASQQLRIAYQAGAWANWYIEENVAGRMREVRPYHALSFIADVNQTWGSIQWVTQANAFLDDPARYRLSTGAVLSLRLFEGFAVTFEGQAAYVRDLINLRGRQVTDEELLLGTSQQPTTYTFEIDLAITYTFGSVHNTIVNPRFGRVDLEEE